MANFTLKVYTPLKLKKWYSNLTPQEKRDLAAFCNKSLSFISQVMGRRIPLSLETAENIAAFSKGVFTLEEIYPLNKGHLQATEKMYEWYKSLSPEEKKELAGLCNITKPWLSRLMSGHAFMTEDVYQKVMSFSKGKLN